MSPLLGCLAWALVGPALVRLVDCLLTLALLRRAVALLEWCAERSGLVSSGEHDACLRIVASLCLRLGAKRGRADSLVLTVVWPIRLFGVLRWSGQHALLLASQGTATRTAVARRRLQARAAAPVGE